MPGSILLTFVITLQAGSSPVPADQLRIGMTAADVRSALGAPDQVCRQVLHRRYVEQWFYKKKNVWVNFDGSKGEELRVRYVFPEK